MEKFDFKKDKSDYGSISDIQTANGEDQEYYQPQMSEEFQDDDTLFQTTIISQKKEGTLGGFLGVFVPCVLSIFGVIIFERLGWVIGQVRNKLGKITFFKVIY